VPPKRKSFQTSNELLYLNLKQTMLKVHRAMADFRFHFLNTELKFGLLFW
jgi:hypothetical protein